MFIALVLLVSPPIQAAPKFWNGSVNGNWNTAGNWDPVGVPANGDTLSFPVLGGGAFLAMTNNIPGAARRFERMDFSAGGYTLRGNSIVVSNGLNSFSGAGANSVFVDVALGATQTFNNSSPQFNLNGDIDLAGFNLTLDSSGALDLINIAGAISGAGNVTKLGEGLVDLEGTTINTYTGTTTVGAGHLRLAKLGGTTAVPGDLVLSPGTRTTWFTVDQVADAADITLGSLATLDLNGQLEVIASLTANTATVDLGGGTLTLGGDVTISGATTAVLAPGTLSLGTFSRTITCGTPSLLSIAANLTGGLRFLAPTVVVHAGFTKEGGGTLSLSGTNSYGGGTFVNAGAINANSDTAFGATFVALGSPGVVTINPAGRITLNNADIGNKSLFVNRPDTGSAMTSTGVSSWGGVITLNSNAQFTTGGTLALSNSITGPGGLTLASTTPAAVFRFAGTVANDFLGDLRLRDGTLELAKTGGLVLAVPDGVTIGDPGDSSSVKTVRYLNTLQTEGDVTINCLGVLDLNNNSDTIDNLTMAGGTVNTGVGTLQVNGSINVLGALSPCDDNVINGRLAFFGATSPRFINMPVGSLVLGAPDLTINAILGGVPTMVLSGNSGRVFLNGANTFTGVLRLESTSNELLVRLNNPAALGATAAGTVLDGVLLELGGFNFSAEPLTNASLGTVVRTIGNNNHGGPIVLTFDLVVTNTAAVTELSGIISGPGDLHKQGAGTLRFSGSSGNSFGGMFVEQGLFEMNKTVGFRAASPLIIGGGANTAIARHLQANQTDFVQVNFNSLYDLNGDDETLASLTLHDGGDVTTGPGVLSMTGTVTVTGGTLALGDTVSSISGNLNLGASGTRTFSVAERSSIIIGSDPAELIVGAVVSGAASLSKTGAGDMSLTAANTFTGNVSVSDGELLISNDDALGSTIGSTTLTGDALLGVSGNITVAGESLTLNTAGQSVDGAVHNTSGSNNWTGSIFLTRTAVIKVETDTVLVLSGALNGDFAGSSGVTKTGPGRLEFAGGTENTYPGVTRVNEGTLELRRFALNVSIPGDLIIGDGIGGSLSDVVRLVGNPQIATASDVTINSSGLLDLNEEAEDIGTLSGSGRVDLGASGTGQLILNANGNTEYSGQIIGAGVTAFAFRKRGTGTFTLSGNNNTYIGTNFVEQGTMLVNGSQSQSPFVVLSGATLGGNGRIGILDVNNLGSLAPGVSPGRFRSGPARLRTGSNFRVELNSPTPMTGYDQLSVSGSIDLNGAQLIGTKGADYAPADGEELVIVNNDGVDAVIGTFGGLTEGTVVTAGGVRFRLSYVGGDGNDVTLTVTNIPARFVSARVESGNGNGRMDPNECDHLFIALENRTGSALNVLNARLDSLTPRVAVTQYESDYPTIPALSFGTNTTPFQIRVAPDFPCGQNIQFNLVLSAAGFANFSIPFTLNSGGAGAPVTFNSIEVPKVIPDLGSTNSTLFVSGLNNFRIGKARVSLHANHPSAGDLRFRIVSPAGASVLLAANRGGTGNNYGNNCGARTTFDDAAAVKIAAANAPFNGVFAPEENLSAFIGQLSGGTWTLLAEDSVSGDGGSLQCWSLELLPAICADGGGACESCVASLAGTLTSSLTLPERLNLTGEPSGCGNVKLCPGVTGSGVYRYTTHAFTNNGPNTCLTVVLTASPSATNTLLSAAYLDRFLPSDLCANYLGDIGDDIHRSSGNYVFRVPAGARFEVMIQEFFPFGINQAPISYVLQLHGLPCPPPTLFIEKVPTPPNRVRLHWSTAYPAFQLQRSETLNGAPPFPFVNVPGVPFVIDSDYTVTNSATANDDYFRLRKP